MKVKTSELTGRALDWMVTKALGGCVLVNEAAVRAYLMSLDEDDLWNTLCAHTPGGMDASIMSNAEMIDYGVRYWQQPAYSTEWAQGGPIIDREGICIKRELPCSVGYEWNSWQHTKFGNGDASGPTSLIAAMRCFVASKLGEEVEVPDGLA